MANTVHSLRRADRIIERLIDLRMATVSTLSDELDMPLSTVYDYVCTLESMDYLTKLPDGRYRVSTHFLDIGNEVRYQYEIYTTAKPELQELAAETGGYAVLMIEEGGLGVILSMEEGERSPRILIQRTYAGTKTQLNTTATGKAILSELPEERVRSIIDEYGLSAKTENSITAREELFGELERIRETGYAIDDEERFEGVRGIGVPVVSKPDDVVAAIGLYGPITQLTETMLHEELPDRMREVENVIQITLTYS